MSRFRRLFRLSSRTRDEIRADVAEEIRFHLEMRTRELVAQGRTSEDARAEARRQFGDIDNAVRMLDHSDARRQQTMRAKRWAEEVRQDVVYGWRAMNHHLGLTGVAIFTIALGIGISAVMFAVVHAVLVAPLPYRDAERLVTMRLSMPDYEDLRRTSRVFEETGIWASNLYNLDEDQVLGMSVSFEVFAILDVSPQIGRYISREDGPAPLVVLSDGLWHRRFGGDPGVLGRTIRLNGAPHVVIGIMPARFRFPSSATELWTNFANTRTQVPAQFENRALRIFRFLGRLRRGVTAEQMQVELDTLSRRLRRDYPQTNADVTLTGMSLLERQVGDVRMSLWFAFGSVLCLLLIACANVANLLLARTTTRVQELAVRLALGASRRRLARQLLTEGLLLSAIGGGLGVLAARWGVAAIPALLSERLPRAEEIVLSPTVLLGAAVLIILTGVFFGLAPIAHLTAIDAGPALKESGGRGETDSRFGRRFRSALVVAQVSIAVVVLGTAGLLTRSFLELRRVDPGFEPERLLTFNVMFGTSATAPERAQRGARVLESIATLPDVVSVGGATGLAPTTAQRGTRFETEMQTGAPEAAKNAFLVAASPGYFEAMQTRLLAGRAFVQADSEKSARVVVVNEALVRAFFDGRHPVGRRIRLVNPEYSDEWRTVVGVVQTIRYQGLDEADQPAVYVPFAQEPFLWMYVHVRTAGDPLVVLPSIRNAVRRVDPQVTVAAPRSMQELIAESSADPRFLASLISTFGALALLLAAIGLYGVMAYSVARQAREIGIRVALGARPARVWLEVVVHAMLLTAPGLALGLVGVLVAGRLIETLLFGISTADPLALTIVTAVFVGVALTASALPARRAVSIDPVVVLRQG